MYSIVLTSNGVIPGCLARISAQIPASCGVANELPDATVVPPPGHEDAKPGTYFIDTETTLDYVHVQWDNGPRHPHDAHDLEPLDLISRIAELADADAE